MYLEEIVKTYGMNDYYDNIGQKIYELSNAAEDPANPQELLIPVKDVAGDGLLVGYARMRKVG